MDHELDPVVGHWYTDIDDGRTFVILAVDEDRGIIEIQHADGETEELDLGEWEALALEPAEAPDDWTGDVGEADEDDDVSFTDTDAALSWRAPAGGARRRQSLKEDWDEDDDEDVDDDWDEEPDEDYYDSDR
ncbi:MAG TPA: DUF6763 family protein [Gammaproteobacteria bacterium]